MTVHLPRWVERNDYLVRKGKAGSKVYLVPVLSVTRPELNSIYEGKRTRHLMLLLTMELYCIYLGSMYVTSNSGQSREANKIYFQFHQIFGCLIL